MGRWPNQNKANNESVSQDVGQVGSLDGSVNINAGNNYNQKVADVVAGKDINITARTSASSMTTMQAVIVNRAKT